MHVTRPRCRCGIPILYYDELSPQSRSCYMLIKVLGIDVELQPINAYNGKHLNVSHRKISIPRLIDGQYSISEGHNIMIYLCDKYAGVYLPHLCPCDYLSRLNVLNMLFYEGCVLHRRYSHLVTEICVKKYPNVNMGYHQAKVLDSYNYLDNNLKGQLCLTGNCLTIADLSVISTLSGLDLIFPISPYKWPNLHRWFENLRTMDCYKCNDGGIQQLSFLLATEGQYPLPSRSTLETSPNQRSSSLQPSAPTDKTEWNSLKLRENTELPRNEWRYLGENEISDVNDRKPTTNEILRKSESACNRVITSASNEGQTEEIQFSKFFPKIRTSKVIVSPLHSTYYATGSSSPCEELYENPDAKDIQDSEVACGVEDCQPERNMHYKAADCLCCCTPSILNKSKRDLNQRVHMNECNHSEKCNMRMTELPRNERRFLMEKDIAEGNGGNPITNEILRESESAPSEDQTEEIQFSNFFPKIRTSKTIINPAYSSYHTAASQREQLYGKPGAKELQDREMACGVEDFQPERNMHYKAADCLYCCRSSSSNKSKMDSNQRVHMNECNHTMRRTEPIHYSHSVQPTLKYTFDDQCPCCYDRQREARSKMEVANRQCGCNCQDNINDKDCESYEEDNCECDDDEDTMLFLIS